MAWSICLSVFCYARIVVGGLQPITV